MYCSSCIIASIVFISAQVISFSHDQQPDERHHTWSFNGNLVLYLTKSKKDSWSIATGGNSFQKAVRVTIPVEAKDITVEDDVFHFSIEWTGDVEKFGNISLYMPIEGIIEGEEVHLACADSHAKLYIRNQWRYLDTSAFSVHGKMQNLLFSSATGSCYGDDPSKMRGSAHMAIGDDKHHYKRPAVGQLHKENSMKKKNLRRRSVAGMPKQLSNEDRKKDSACSCLKHFFLKFKVSFMGASIEIETWTFTRDMRPPISRNGRFQQEGSYEDMYVDQFLEDKGVRMPVRTLSRLQCRRGAVTEKDTRIDGNKNQNEENNEHIKDDENRSEHDCCNGDGDHHSSGSAFSDDGVGVGLGLDQTSELDIDIVQDLKDKVMDEGFNLEKDFNNDGFGVGLDEISELDLYAEQDLKDKVMGEGFNLEKDFNNDGVGVDLDLDQTSELDLDIVQDLKEKVMDEGFNLEKDFNNDGVGVGLDEISELDLYEEQDLKDKVMGEGFNLEKDFNNDGVGVDLDLDQTSELDLYEEQDLTSEDNRSTIGSGSL